MIRRSFIGTAARAALLASSFVLTLAAPQFAHAVDDGVGTGAAGIRLQADAGRLPSRAEIFQDGIGGELSMHGAHEAAERRFQDVQAACEALLRQKCRQGSAL